MTPSEPTVYVVDDDEAFRDSLAVLFNSIGLRVEVYESAVAFLDAFDGSHNSCLVLDIRMPGMSGLELQAELNERHAQIPIIFMTGHGDVPLAVRAMKAGALDFLPKPFSHQDLLDLVQSALHGEALRAEDRGRRRDIRQRRERLTQREAEVMDMVVEGLANKVIASQLGISQRTVEIHRSQVMQKMEASSLAELVRLAMILEDSAS